MQSSPLPRMIEVARGHSNVLQVLLRSGEFTAAEIAEYLPEVQPFRGECDPLRMGALS